MKVVNRKARHDYQILTTAEAGIRLTGPEVKSVKSGRVKLTGAYVKLINQEAYLINATIPPYPYARQENYDPNRTRKLLLHKKEILSMQSKKAGANLTLVALSCYTKRGFIKVRIGLAKGKKKYEKKREKKRKDIKREIEREIRNSKQIQN